MDVLHATVTEDGKRIRMPALANAHDHARTFRSSSLGAFNVPFESWNPFVTRAPQVDAYLANCVSLARTARSGVGAIMIHYTRAQRLVDPVSEARQVARAAQDVGVRIAFAVAMGDMNPIAYAPTERVLPHLRPSIRDEVVRNLARPVPTIAEQLALADEIAVAIASPTVNVQYGPRGPKWASRPMLEAVAAASAASGRRVHMHFAETRYEREWIDAHYPEGVLKWLASIGLLSPRLSLAHCTYARDEELALMAEHGVIAVLNSGSNLTLRSGIAPVARMLKHGVRVAIGGDGLTLDDDDDMLRELRLTWHLHKGWGFDAGLGVADAVRAATAGGYAAITGDETLCGRDAVEFDLADLADDWGLADVDPIDYVVARAQTRHVARLEVAGRVVFDAGRFTGIDYAAMRTELLAAARGRGAEFAAWHRVARELAEDLGPFYRNRLHTCT